MNQTRKQQPSDSELEILQVLWNHGPSTVRYVNQELNKIRKVGYTTTLKIMQIMHDKGLVIRDEGGRSHIYSAFIEENAIQNRLIKKMVNAAFGGSASQLIMQILGNHKTSKAELDDIKQLIDKLENSDDHDLHSDK